MTIYNRVVINHPLILNYKCLMSESYYKSLKLKNAVSPAFLGGIGGWGGGGAAELRSNDGVHTSGLLQMDPCPNTHSDSTLLNDACKPHWPVAEMVWTPSFYLQRLHRSAQWRVGRRLETPFTLLVCLFGKRFGFEKTVLTAFTRSADVAVWRLMGEGWRTGRVGGALAACWLSR